jgi:hypothetical protein
MYYSESIWNLHYKERKTVKEIVAQLDTPLLNEKYVSTVIENNRWLRRMPSRDIPGVTFPEIYKKINSMITMRQRAGLHRRPRKHPKKLW